MRSDEHEASERQKAERMDAALREALQRHAAPQGLEERILARAMAERGPRAATEPTAWERAAGRLLLPFPGRRSAGRGFARREMDGPRWVLQRIAASVALGAVVAGAAAYYQTEQRRRSEAAQAEQTRAQVIEALRITSRTLDRVQDKLNQ